MDKIKMTNPIVEMDGDEMTHILWGMIKDQLIKPFVDLNTEYYDLSLPNRDRTEDAVTRQAAEAIKRLHVGVKCATITPNYQRQEEYGLKQLWKSPNATIRAALDGTVFRAPILISRVKPVVTCWKKPISASPPVSTSAARPKGSCAFPTPIPSTTWPKPCVGWKPTSASVSTLEEAGEGMSFPLLPPCTSRSFLPCRHRAGPDRIRLFFCASPFPDYGPKPCAAHFSASFFFASGGRYANLEYPRQGNQRGGTMAEAPIIDIVNLEKRYRSKNTDVFALQGINLAINKGDIFGVIGKSGAGKSTLVRCINMLERPTGGSIFFEGKDMCRLSESELRAARRSMGMIFQQFNLLMQRTARQNVCFPLELIGMDKVQPRKRAEELLDLVGLANRMDSYPSQLSGGQKQRVAIARALATNPQVLLCDEATSALDPATTDSILSLIKDINRDLGITAVIITHEMSVIEKICSHVAIIHRGKIVEHGEVEEVFFHPRTEAARRLVMPEALQNLPQENLYRLIFNGRSSFEPVIANMVLECHCPVNIMYADTRDIGGIAFGQMVLQLPECPESRRSILEFAKSRNILLEEMKHV